MRDPRTIGDHDQPQTMSDALDTPRPRDHFTISFSAKTIAVIFGILLAVWMVRELSSTLLIFAGAILLATAIDKPASSMEARGIKRGVAILLIFAVVIGLLAVIVALLIPLVSQEVTNLRGNLGSYQREIERFLDRFDIGNNGAPLSLSAITQRLNGNLESIASSLTKVTIAAGHAAVVLFATLVISFMLASNPTGGTNFARRFLNTDTHARMQRISGDIHGRIGSWVRGQILVAISFGTLFGLGLWAIGIPFAASLALTAIVLEVIPYLGGAITLAIAAAVAFSIGIPQLILVLVLYAVLINVESHILAPKLIGEAVGLPSVVVLAALFIGLETKGIVGVLLAVPTVLVIAAILDEFWPAPNKADKDEGRIEQIQHWLHRLYARLFQRA